MRGSGTGESNSFFPHLSSLLSTTGLATTAGVSSSSAPIHHPSAQCSVASTTSSVPHSDLAPSLSLLPPLLFGCARPSVLLPALPGSAHEASHTQGQLPTESHAVWLPDLPDAFAVAANTTPHSAARRVDPSYALVLPINSSLAPSSTSRLAVPVSHQGSATASPAFAPLPTCITTRTPLGMVLARSGPQPAVTLPPSPFGSRSSALSLDLLPIEQATVQPPIWCTPHMEHSEAHPRSSGDSPPSSKPRRKIGEGGDAGLGEGLCCFLG
ncbi:hypothetical protein B0H19DRAFT_1267668 [Mycena capillaripes]|nr:hypothetical protein B0H19DRAFT_1267668 [Mycena capillaripes]